ncbi:MAG: hypothetical protein AAGJ91_12745 [Pseudomonadota bacterium]
MADDTLIESICREIYDPHIASPECWPEHEGDTGERGDAGYLCIVSPEDQEVYREAARKAVALVRAHDAREAKDG